MSVRVFPRGPAKKYFFCYLDILGYKILVDKLIMDRVRIIHFKNEIDRSVFKLQEKIIPTFNESTFVTGIFKSIKVSLISDSILIRLPIGRAEVHNVTSTCFLYYVSLFVISLISEVGLFLRGGIAVGRHYEDTASDNQFIFSQALIDAYHLEQHANSVRIIIDYPSFNKNISLGIHSNLNEIFYSSEDNHICLNYYYLMQELTDLKLKIPDIVRAFYSNISANIGNEKIISKYVHFVNYHNNVMRGMGLSDFFIDIQQVIKSQ